MFRNKKSQEEMVGFVLIMVVVAVIFLILIGIYFRSSQSTERVDSIEVSQFLDSLMDYTTSCAVDYEPSYESVKDLIRYCYEGAICTSQEKSCDVLKEELTNIIESSWTIGEESPYAGYSLTSVFVSDKTGARTQIISPPVARLGVCDTTISLGADRAQNYKGTRNTIITTFILCLN